MESDKLTKGTGRHSESGDAGRRAHRDHGGTNHREHLAGQLSKTCGGDWWRDAYHRLCSRRNTDRCATYTQCALYAAATQAANRSGIAASGGKPAPPGTAGMQAPFLRSGRLENRDPAGMVFQAARQFLRMHGGSPIRQESRSASAAAAPTLKGTAPNRHPDPAGTAAGVPSASQSRQTVRPSAPSAKKQRAARKESGIHNCGTQRQCKGRRRCKTVKKTAGVRSMDEKDNSRSSLQTAADLGRAAKSSLPDCAGCCGVWCSRCAAAAAVKETVPALVKFLLVVLLIMIVIPMVVFTALPNIFSATIPLIPLR